MAFRHQSLSERRGSGLKFEELSVNTSGVMMGSSVVAGGSKLAGPSQQQQQRPAPPRGPPTPSMSTPAAGFDQLPASPPHPPTPAASPGPMQNQPDWSEASDDEDYYLVQMRHHFKACSGPRRTRILAELLNLCTSQQLSFVHQHVSPLLKKDPFTSLPDELCLRILSFIDDPKVLARASQVSRRWRDLLADDMTWKNLCVKHDYGRRLSEVHPAGHHPHPLLPLRPGGLVTGPSHHPLVHSDSDMSIHSFPGATPGAVAMHAPSRSFDGSMSVGTTIATDEGGVSGGGLVAGPTASGSGSNSNNNGGSSSSSSSSSNSLHPGAFDTRRPLLRSYKSHFKQRYLVEAAWRSGGRNISRNITQDAGVVTSLHLTPKYIVVALDNARIHLFDTEGNQLRTLQGHVMGVWAMVPWDDILVSGGCDRDVRVWDLTTGTCLHTLRGHTSTVRCLKMSDANTAISGSRDTTLRVWDIRTGLCRNVLVGHQASVRCLEIKGDIVVSGSYDTTAKVWSISEGRCLQTLTGHFSQIYAIAFDGVRVATGSLDTSVRIWDARSGECLALLQGHTSLVGQLQMRGDTLVTGGSDGSVRVWSLERMCPIHRLAAHDNSVTSLQFDDTRVVSGGSDGRVKVWDLKTGHLVRELITPSEAVWRVAFEDEKCVAMALRGGRTVMEVWSFSPPEDVLYERPLSLPPSRREDGALGRPSSSLGFRKSDQGIAASSSSAGGGGGGGSVMMRTGTPSEDVDMRDAGPSGPSTAPLQRTFFDSDP